MESTHLEALLHVPLAQACPHERQLPHLPEDSLKPRHRQVRGSSSSSSHRSIHRSNRWPQPRHRWRGPSQPPRLQRHRPAPSAPASTAPPPTHECSASRCGGLPSVGGARGWVAHTLCMLLCPCHDTGAHTGARHHHHALCLPCMNARASAAPLCALWCAATASALLPSVTRPGGVAPRHVRGVCARAGERSAPALPGHQCAGSCGSCCC